MINLRDVNISAQEYIFFLIVKALTKEESELLHIMKPEISIRLSNNRVHILQY